MNVDYILTKKHIKIKNHNVTIGDAIDQINALIPSVSSESATNTKNTIVSEGDFQLHFKDHALNMWSLSPEHSYFGTKSKKIKLRKLSHHDFVKILYKNNIRWEFDQELTFSEQLAIRLENNVKFLFSFSKKNKKGILKKVIA